VKHWLLHMCWQDVSTLTDCGKPHTLSEFVKEAESRSSFSPGNSHFLFVKPKTDFLTMYKTKKLTEAVREALETK
jgi:hypothetical protein